jgi:hypothetical protein
VGWVTMSERDIRRIGVLSEVINEQRTVASAASLLAVSARHVRRLVLRMASSGGSGIGHKGRGRPSNRRVQAAVRDRALALVREHYPDFGPTLAAEMLGTRHALMISRETLRKWMLDAGIWLSRRQRRTFHQPRTARQSR